MKNIKNRLEKLELQTKQDEPNIIFIDIAGVDYKYYKCDDIIVKKDTAMEDLEKAIFNQCKNNEQKIYIAIACNEDGGI